MQIQINKDRLLELMIDFYLLTNIRMVLFDGSYREILSYPEERCDFCALMHANETTAQLCRKSDLYSFEKCRERKGLFLYDCHAGLVEATVPIFSGEAIIGYIMMGQIMRAENSKDIYDIVCSKIPTECFDRNKLVQTVFSIKNTTEEKIFAASRILEVSTHYILGESLVKYQKKTFIQQLNKFIDENISEEITPQAISNYFGISRSKLYTIFREQVECGVAEYVKDRRLIYSCNLLKKDNISVTTLASMAGFSDYNYFCRCYRKKFGTSPKKEAL